jgi:hypothetical protein
MTDVMNAQAIPLAEAVLCQDCGTVTDATWTCPKCGGAVLMSLANVLDRETEEDAEPELREEMVCA